MTLNVNLTPELAAMVREKVATGLYSSASEVVREALRLMQEKDRFNKMKLDLLRADIQAGIASGDAGALDIEEIKRRGRARLGKPSLHGARDIGSLLLWSASMEL